MSLSTAAPVVVVVDTSRSLTGDDLELVRHSLQQIATRLPPATRVGLVAFNDEPTWLVAAGSEPAALVEALPRLVPDGSYTVLHDALYVAARELAAGGVILLVSDGRDEGSATMVEDVARLCGTNQVRIVAAGIGRRTHDRALRRLVLLTKGELADRIEDAGPALADALAATTSQLSTAAANPAADTTTVESEPPPGPVDEAIPGADSAEPAAPPWLLPALAAAAVVVAAVVVVIAGLLIIYRRRGRLRSCDRCGMAFEKWEESCPVCEIRALEEATATQPVARLAVPARSDEVALDSKVFEKAPQPPGVGQTLVLDEGPVAILREPGKPSRSYTLPTDKVFTVGRAPEVNTLQVSDPTVSAQHFKLVPKDGEFYVVDLQTTNGTTVNRQRIRVRKLRPNDIIGAGALELEFSIRASLDTRPSAV
jgi:pSer/pThr/pTyr-binding forkhead associated (FHA) protein